MRSETKTILEWLTDDCERANELETEATNFLDDAQGDREDASYCFADRLSTLCYACVNHDDAYASIILAMLEFVDWQELADEIIENAM